MGSVNPKSMGRLLFCCVTLAAGQGKGVAEPQQDLPVIVQSQRETSSTPQFEVVSVKASGPASRGTVMNMDPGRFLNAGRDCANASSICI